MAAQTPINPSDVPEPVAGSYSQALLVEGAAELLFVSGQIPETPDGSIPEDFAGQCRLAWANVIASLRAAGLEVGDLVKVTTFLTDRRYAQENRAIRREFLGDHKPAMTTVIAETLDPQWLLEVEAIAAR